MSGCILIRTEDAVRIFTLNRPHSLNAMNKELVQELRKGLSDLHAVRAIVLEGAGRAFCTGEDLKETLAPQTGGAEELRGTLEDLQEITRVLTTFPGAVVAAVQGFAVGGGAELALASDIVIASRDARFRFPEVAIGHALTGGITTRLPALVGLARAKEMLFTSRWIEADEALRIGMISELTRDPQSKALALARSLATHPQRSLAATKRGVESAAQANLEAQMRWEVDAALYCFSASEAIDAFTRFRNREI